MMISRRDFLKIAGVSAASTSLISLGLPNVLAFPPARGRLLHYVPARYASHKHAEIATHLLPDSVHEIWDIQNGFVRLPSGYVPESAIQPMLEVHQQLPETLPAYIEVSAPYAAVRQYCTADAPLLTRPGHGAVLEAIKILPDQHGKFNWYQVNLENNLSGWVQAHQIQAMVLGKSLTDSYAVIENHQMMIYRHEHEIARFALASPANLVTGTYQITQRHPNMHTSTFKGVPYVLETDAGLKISGAYWHNHFSGDSQHIELSVLAAKSAFTLLSEGSTVTIL